MTKTIHLLRSQFATRGPDGRPSRRVPPPRAPSAGRRLRRPASDVLLEFPVYRRQRAARRTAAAPPVYTYGKYIGQDPDPNVRLQLLRDPGEGDLSFRR